MVQRLVNTLGILANLPARTFMPCDYAIFPNGGNSQDIVWLRMIRGDNFSSLFSFILVLNVIIQLNCVC